MLTQSLYQSNLHFVNALFEAAPHIEIIAKKPLYNIEGSILIGEGTTLSPDLKALILDQQFRNTFEDCLWINIEDLNKKFYKLALEIIEEYGLLKNFFSWKSGELNPLELVKKLQLSPAMAIQLVLLNHLNADNHKHNLFMALVASGMAYYCQQSNAVITDIFYAGLLHDIGMLYIDPQFSKKQSDMSPEEWQHVSSHPIIGKTLVTSVLGLSEQIGRYILEHHERYNGTGYPNYTASVKLSLGGQILALIERILPLLTSSHFAYAKTNVALKVQPRENRPDLVSVFLKNLEKNSNILAPSIQNINPEALQENTHRTFATIANVLSVCDHLKYATDPKNIAVQRLLDTTMQRIDDIQRAFSSAGLDMATHKFGLASAEGDVDDVYQYYEAGLILDELAYRFKELARDLTLKMLDYPAAEVALLTPLLAALDSRLNRSLDLNLSNDVDLF